MSPSNERPRRRWLRALLFVLALLVALLAAAPYVAAPLVKGRIVAALEEGTGAQAELASFSLGWPGDVSVRGLVLRDAAGFEHLRVDELVARAALASAVRGRFVVDAEVRGVRVLAREDAEGRWSFEDLTPAPGEDGAPSAPGGGETPPSSSPPDVKLDLALKDLELVVERAAGPARIALATGAVHLDGLDRPGTVELDGTLEAAGLGQGPLTLRAQVVPMPAGGGLPIADVTFDAACGGDAGVGLHLAAQAQGERASGTLELAARVAALLALAGDASPLAPGAKLDGRVQGNVTFAGGAEGGEVTLALDVADLTGTSPDGAPLDLARIGAPHLALEARADTAAGTAELARLDGRVGPVTITGSGAARGLGTAELAVDGGKLLVDADLEALHAALAPLLDVGETRFGGRLSVDLAADGAGDDLKVTGRIATTDLALDQMSIDGAPFDLAAHVVGPPGAQRLTGELRCARLAVRLDERSAVEQQDLSVTFETGLADLAPDVTATVRGIVLRDAAGFEHARVALLSARAQVPSAAGGQMAVDARLEGVRAVARQDDAGRWSFESLTPPPDEQGARDARKDEAAAAQSAPPDVKLDLALRDVALELERPEVAGGPARLALATGAVHLDGLERPGTVELDGTLEAAGLPPGPLALRAQVVPMPAGGGLPTADVTLDAGLGADAGLALHLSARAEGERASGTLELGARVASLLALAGDASPLAPGATLDGQVQGRATFAGGAEGGDVQLTLDVADLAGTTPGGEALDLARIGVPHLALEARADTAAGTAELARLDGRVGPVTITGSGAARGLGTEQLAVDGGKLLVDADLEALRAALAPLLDVGETSFGGRLSVDLAANGAGDDLAVTGRIETTALTLDEMTIDGEPLDLAAHVVGEPGAQRLSGEVRCARLAVRLDEQRAVEQTDLSVTFEAGLADPARDLSATVRGPFGRLDVARPEDAPADAQAWRARFEGALAPLTELARGLAVPGLEGQGDLSLRADVTLPPGEGSATGPLAFDVELAATGLQASYAPPELADKPPARIDEPQLTVALRGAFDSTAGALDLARFALDSATLRGEAHGRLTGLAAAEPAPPLVADGLEGDFTYVPERLGAWLAPWLPGTLSGADEEPLRLAYDGRLDELDLAVLVGPGAGSATVGVGGFEVLGLRAEGTVELEKRAGSTAVRGDLSANDGAILLRTRLGGEDASGDEAKGAEAHVELDAVRAAAGLAPALALVHPAFAALERGGDLSGVLDATLDLAWDGPLPPDLATLAPSELPLERISGTGRIQLHQAALSGSPFLSQITELLGRDPTKAFDLDELTFRIERGRVHYDRPWTWTVSGIPTSFQGSLGLDGGLDLDWRIPVTESLAAKYPVLAPLAGRDLHVPVKGSAVKPRVDWSGMMEGAAKEALRAEIEQRSGLGGILDGVKGGKGLGDVLGGRKDDPKDKPPTGGAGEQAGEKKDEKSGGGTPPGPGDVDRDDPEALLQLADRLWDEGDKAKAAKFYDMIYDKFRISTTYLLNKARIDRRRKEKDGAP